MRPVTAAALLALAALPLAASTARAQAPAQAGTPAAKILTPKEGEVTGNRVKVTLAAENFQVIPASGTREQGKGHHHLFLDADLTASDSVIPRTAQIVHLGDGSSAHEFLVPTPGKHRIIAVLAWGDHIPVKGARTDTVFFTVKKP